MLQGGKKFLQRHEKEKGKRNFWENVRDSKEEKMYKMVKKFGNVYCQGMYDYRPVHTCAVCYVLKTARSQQVV